MSFSKGGSALGWSHSTARPCQPANNTAAGGAAWQSQVLVSGVWSCSRPSLGSARRSMHRQARRAAHLLLLLLGDTESRGDPCGFHYCPHHTSPVRHAPGSQKGLWAPQHPTKPTAGLVGTWPLSCLCRSVQCAYGHGILKRVFCLFSFVDR